VIAMLNFKKHARTLAVLAAVAITAGAQAPNEGQSENLPAQIDTFLGDYHAKNGLQPLVGHGHAFNGEGSTYNVDPRLVTAIAGAETSFGSYTASTNNAFNWFWNAGTGSHNSPFDNWDSGIHTVSHYLHKSYLLKGYNTIPLIGGRYCNVACEHWVPNVTMFYRTLGADPNGPLSYPGTPPAPQPTLAIVDLPVMTTTLMLAEASKSSANKSLALIVQATFADLNSQTVRSVELYRDSQPARLALLKRVAGTADTAPVFSATFALPEGDMGNDLRVRAQIAEKGRPARELASGILTVPKPTSQAPWLMIGIVVGGFLMLACIVVLAVLLLRRKPAAVFPQPVMMQMSAADARAATATTSHEAPPRTKTGTDAQ
jgi:hypothetical protein